MTLSTTKTAQERCIRLVHKRAKLRTKPCKGASTLCHVHTMPRSRMQYNGALSSAHAAKLIASILKKNFLLTIFQFTKTVNGETHTHHIPCQKLCLTNTVGKYRHGKPLMMSTLCRSNFHAAQHSAKCYSMQKPCRSCAALTCMLCLSFTSRQHYILLHSAIRHSVDSP